MKTPGDGFTTWVSFDAIIAATLGVAMHLVSRTLCIGFLPEAAVVCGSVGAFLGTVAGRFTVEDTAGKPGDNPVGTLDDLNELTRALRGSASMTGCVVSCSTPTDEPARQAR